MSKIISLFEKHKEKQEPIKIYDAMQKEMNLTKTLNDSYYNAFNILVHKVDFSYEDDEYSIKAYYTQLDKNLYKQEDVIIEE